jgi:hypothetical protein
MSDEPTCGKGLAEHSALPKMFGELIDAMAEILEEHQKALDLTDENSKKEHELYVELTQEHRRIADQLQATARRMAGSRDLPMGRHDPQAMASPRPFEAFATFVKLEQELLAMLQKGVERDQKMLDAMHESGG